jgi:hypothetical protein
MTATSGFSQEFENYLDGWAQMMISIWEERMSAYGIDDTGALRKSLRTEVYRQSGGNAAKISHFYLLYGKYVDVGIGPELSANGRLGKDRNSPGQFKEAPKRQAKPCLKGKYRYGKRKLPAKMIEETGRAYLQSIRDVFLILIY